MSTLESTVSQEQQALTPRQNEVLKALIGEYVETAQPVASGRLSHMAKLGVSSATLRSELALLEELGYVEQPHTSAGRTPTAKGYRYYVEQLMGQQDLPAPEKRTIMHQFYQVRLNLDQWMQLTAAVLAHTAEAVALVTPPQANKPRFKHLELISTHDTLCLMILVFQDGSIHQEMLATTPNLDQAVFSQASNQLNALLYDKTTTQIRVAEDSELLELRGWRRQVLERVVRVMTSAESQEIDQVYRDGIMNVYREPEFQDQNRFLNVIQVLEGSQLIESILGKTLNASGVQIIIGGEGPYEEIHDVSMVLSPYGIRDRASGVLGILGPTRMQYGRAISTVRYVAQVLDSLVADVYGQ